MVHFKEEERRFDRRVHFHDFTARELVPNFEWNIKSQTLSREENPVARVKIYNP